MPTGWRIVKTRLAARAFDGEGARRYGGRWNSPGTRMVYTSQSVSLAVLELLVHLQASPLLASYALRSTRFDARLVSAVDRSSLPSDWRAFPAPPALQRIGDAWIAGGSSVVLEVPSAIVEGESNYLINPTHPDFRRLRSGPPVRFRLDPRLLGR
jgi:RES domain-containing protein